MDRKLLGLIIAVAWVLVLGTGRARATDFPTYADGFVEGAYTHKGGLWYNATGTAHTRHKEYYQEGGGYTRSACNYGCGYTMSYVAPQRYFYWAYVAVASPATYVAPTLPSYTDAGWRGKLLDIAKERDRTELAIRKETVEQAAYLDSLKALGFNFSIQGYGQHINYPTIAGYAGSYNNYAVPVINAGQTQYGYSFQSLQSAYGALDMNALFQASERLATGARDSATQANTEFSGLVGQAGTNAARVAQALAKAAEIREQGQAAASALNAAKAAPSTTTITTGQGGGVGTATQQGASPGQPPPTPIMPQAVDAPQANAAGGNGAEFLRTVGLPLCASCHGQGAPNQKVFDITTYPSLSRDRKADVWARLVSDSEAKVMPREVGNPSKPGQPVTMAQLLSFFKS